MTETKTNYAAIKVPEAVTPEDYSTEQRRADILRVVHAAGDPGAIKQVRLAERYGVHESTISRDMDALRESVDEHMGTGAKLETSAQAEKTIRELQDAGKWYQAWKVRQDLNTFLFDTGHVHREPERREVDVRRRELAYTVVREGEDDDLPTTDTGEPDYEAIGFSSGPVEVTVETPEAADE